MRNEPISNADVLIPSLTLPDAVLLPHLNWGPLYRFRYLATLRAAAAWARMTPLASRQAAKRPEGGSETHYVFANERNLPLLLQLLCILRRALSTGEIADLSDTIAPGNDDFTRLTLDASPEPAWDDVDGGRQFPLRAFLVCLVLRNLLSLGKGARVVVTEPKQPECMTLLLELKRLSAIGGPSFHVGSAAPHHQDHHYWDYISNTTTRVGGRGTRSAHQQIIVGLGIASPSLVYRHLIRTAHRPSDARRKSPGAGLAALNALRLLPRMGMPSRRSLRTLGSIAYDFVPPEYRALACYEVALQLCHESSGTSAEEAGEWLSRGFKCVSAAAGAKQFIWEIRLRNCDALLSYRRGDTDAALRKLHTALRALTAASPDETAEVWASCIVMLNTARILRLRERTLGEAVEIWGEVERIGSGPQQEYAIGEQVKAFLKLGRFNDAVAKARKYCANERYLSIHLDWELAFRRLYCLAALRVQFPGCPTPHDLARVSELEWWCGGNLAHRH
jgi:hypothetical protein